MSEPGSAAASPAPEPKPAPAPAPGAARDPHLIASVTGRNRREAGVARAAFLLAALLAGYRVAVAGRLPALACGLGGAAALAALGYLAWDLDRAGRTIAETLALGGLTASPAAAPRFSVTLASGFYAIAAAGLLVVASALAAALRRRRRGRRAPA